MLRADSWGRARVKSIEGPRLYWGTLLYSYWTELVVGVVAIFNFSLVLIDTDLHATGERTPIWIVIANWICLAVYTVELTVRAYVERWFIFQSSWNWLDMVALSSGLLTAVFDLARVDIVSLVFLRLFRCIRLLRIFKAFILMTHLRELRKLVQGVASCIKTLFWSFMLTSIFMTMWATLAVEMIHPIMEEIGFDDGCDRCPRSFASIMDANLTFFQTVIAGDSWGRVAIPVIEEKPWAAIIFVGSFFSLIVGILNLIVAVLVDNLHETRAKDLEARARDAQEAEINEKSNLERIFGMIDLDGSGTVSFEELEQASHQIREFTQRLRVMDIQGDDLRQLFMMLDEDGNGEIDPEEFIETLYRMKCGDAYTAATFVKRYVVHMQKQQNIVAQKMGHIEFEVHNLKKLFATTSRNFLRQPQETFLRQTSDPILVTPPMTSREPIDFDVDSPKSHTSRKNEMQLQQAAEEMQRHLTTSANDINMLTQSQFEKLQTMTSPRVPGNTDQTGMFRVCQRATLHDDNELISLEEQFIEVQLASMRAVAEGNLTHIVNKTIDTSIAEYEESGGSAHNKLIFITLVNRLRSSLLGEISSVCTSGSDESITRDNSMQSLCSDSPPWSPNIDASQNSSGLGASQNSIGFGTRKSVSDVPPPIIQSQHSKTSSSSSSSFQVSSSSARPSRRIPSRLRDILRTNSNGR